MARKLITLRRLSTFVATLLLSLLLVGFSTGTIQRTALRDLDWAVLHDKYKFAKVLLLLGTDPNGKVEPYFICGNDTSGISDYHRPLHSAAGEGSLEGTKILLDYGADVNARDRFGRTALWHATLWGKMNAVRLLLSKGAVIEIHPRSSDGVESDSLFELAADDGNTEMLQFLIDKGFGDANDLNKALWDAVWMNKPEAARFLISKGADVNFDLNHDGYSLLKKAKEHGDGTKLVAVLEQAGAKE
jgi:ankyrin repeat protein